MTHTTLFVLISVVVVLAIAWAFNRLIRQRNYCRNSFSQIDVQLKKRHDLVPNLVSVAQGYLEHEASVLERVIKARQLASDGLIASRNDVGALVALQTLLSNETGLTSALHGLFANVEAYPDLKANQQMQLLHQELVHIENSIAYARQAYNDSVMFYNIDVESFPLNVIAKLTGFKTFSQLEFEIDSGAPKVFK